MNGILLKSHILFKELIEKAKTKTGLKITASISDKTYFTKRKYSKGFKKNMKIEFDEYLGKWNYKAVPMSVGLC